MKTRTNVWLITAASLVILGGLIFVGVMTFMGWNFLGLDSSTFESNLHTVSESFSDISVSAKTADIVFLPAEDGQCRVECYEDVKMKHSVTVKDGTLYIEALDTREWYDHLGPRFKKPKITVCLPEGEYGKLGIKNTTGDIHVESVSVSDLDIAVTTGDISISGVSCAGDVKIDGVTGDAVMKDLVAGGSLNVKLVTGKVHFDACDAARLTVKTVTGSVSGTLLTDKTFIANTTTGRVSVPDGTSGGRCEITVTTGSINVEIKK